MKTNHSNLPSPKSIIQELETIAIKAKGSNFTQKFIKSVTPSGKVVAKLLGCTELQAILFSVMFTVSFKKNIFSLDDLSDYLDCNPVTLMSYLQDINQLTELQVIRKYTNERRSLRKRKHSAGITDYFVPNDIYDTLSNEEPFVPMKMEGLDLYGFLDAAFSVLSERDSGDMTFDELKSEIRQFMEANSRLELVKILKKLKLDEDNVLILLFLCHEFIDDTDSFDLVRLLKTIFPDLKKQLGIRQEFLNGTNELVEKDLAVLEEGDFLSDRDMKLTERAINLIFGNDKTLFTQKKPKKRADVILSDDIEHKPLHFNSAEKSSIDFLTKSLFPSNFSRISSRMKKSGLQQGFAALFYGSAGTGKTECVYQMARKTGRDIKVVSISETKSMWFGQSEKLIQKVFDDYHKMVESTKIAPILFFNEADGVFGTRKKIGSSPVDQTENTIQNIILQEMEKLNGILIAATNLTENLDKAFDRRFLYKIRFEKPSIEARCLIWKDKIPALSDQSAKHLAERYNLTGGQIDNVARKYLMKNILYGIVPNLSEIESFCNEENMGEMKGIGFLK